MRIGQSLGGSPPPDSLEALLPFPSNSEVHADGKRFAVSKTTATKFFELVAANKLPAWAAGDLVRYTQQWKRLANS
jgi:hypothetical protein